MLASAERAAKSLMSSAVTLALPLYEDSFSSSLRIDCWSVPTLSTRRRASAFSTCIPNLRLCFMTQSGYSQGLGALYSRTSPDLSTAVRSTSLGVIFLARRQGRHQAQAIPDTPQSPASVTCARPPPREPRQAASPPRKSWCLPRPQPPPDCAQQPGSHLRQGLSRTPPLFAPSTS